MYCPAASMCVRPCRGLGAALASGAADGKDSVSALMRVAWRSLERVVEDQLDCGRPDGFGKLGCDGASRSLARRFLTCAAYYDTGGVVWSPRGAAPAPVMSALPLFRPEQGGSWSLNPRTSCAGVDPQITGRTERRPSIWSRLATRCHCARMLRRW